MIIGAIRSCVCEKCKITSDRYVKLEDFHKGKSKCRCGGTLKNIDFGKGHSTRWNNILIDQTIGRYDNQLGEYVGSTSDRRRICKEKGLVDIGIGEQRQIKSKAPTQEETQAGYKQMFLDSADKNNIALPSGSY